MKKRILVLGNHEIVIYNFRKELINSLIEEGYDVYLSYPEGKNSDYFEDIGCNFIDTPVDRHGINPLKDIKLIARYVKLIKDIDPAVILTYTIKPTIYGGLVSRVLNKKTIVNITGIGTTLQKESLIKKIIVALYKQSLKSAEMLFFQNIANKIIFSKNGIHAKNEEVLPGSGVNLAEFEFTPLTKNDSTNFLFIGRIMKDKGIEEYLFAAKKLKEKNQNCNFHVIGFFEEENYKDIIKNYHNQGIINYHGFQENVKPFIVNADCVVNPSHHEGMSNVLLESGAMGRPLIAADINGCKEIIEDSVNGFLFNVKDKENLYEKMELFSKLKQSEKQKMSIESRKKIENEFSRNIIVEKYNVALKTILEDKEMLLEQ